MVSISDARTEHSERIAPALLRVKRVPQIGPRFGEGSSREAVCGHPLALALVGEQQKDCWDLAAAFGSAPPLRMHSTDVESSTITSILMGMICSKRGCSKTRRITALFEQRFYARVDAVPVAEPLRYTAPLAGMLGHDALRYPNRTSDAASTLPVRVPDCALCSQLFAAKTSRPFHSG
jgi:hypothetical protein